MPLDITMGAIRGILAGGTSGEEPAALWTPADLGVSGTLWFDAGTNLTLSGTNVLGWTDRYSAATTASNLTASARPVYAAGGVAAGLGSIYFDGGDFLCFPTPTNLLATSAKSIFYIGKGDSSVFNIYNFTIATCILYGGVSNNNAGYALVFRSTDTLLLHAGGGSAVSAGLTQTTNEIVIGSCVKQAGTTANLVAFFKDGSAYALSANPALNGTPETDGGFTSIGRQANSSQRSWMGEVIVVPGAVGTDERQRIEGYLAHKWGRQASLPTGHPYKTTAPTR
jgi:hypothetical protein